MINHDVQASDHGAHVKLSTPVQEAMEVTNNQLIQAAIARGEEFWIPNRNNTSEDWDNYKKFDENEIYYAICLHFNKKISRDKSKQKTSMWR